MIRRRSFYDVSAAFSFSEIRRNCDLNGTVCVRFRTEAGLYCLPKAEHGKEDSIGVDLRDIDRLRNPSFLQV